MLKSIIKAFLWGAFALSRRNSVAFEVERLAVLEFAADLQYQLLCFPGQRKHLPFDFLNLRLEFGELFPVELGLLLQHQGALDFVNEIFFLEHQFFGGKDGVVGVQAEQEYFLVDRLAVILVGAYELQELVEGLHRIEILAQGEGSIPEFGQLLVKLQIHFSVLVFERHFNQPTKKKNVLYIICGWENKKASDGI